MSNSSISGLELFQMPFSNHVSRQTQASRQQDTGRQQHPAAAQDKVPQQAGRQTAVQQPVTQKPAEQAAKPTAAAVHKPDTAPSKRDAEEIKYAKLENGTKDTAPVEADKTQTDLTVKQPSAAKTEEQPETQKKELVLDMSSGSAADGGDTACAGDDADRHKAHEAAEAKRKAEWEAKQPAKQQAESAAVQKLQSMSDDEAVAASIGRVKTDVERITRRNLKECVSDHIQDLCRKDPAFARKTMHPRKSMINCFKYINRQAKEYVRQEMEDNDIKPDNGGYGCDVPDGLCYQWAEDYFNDPDAPEDQKKEDKSVPEPHAGAASKQKKAASRTKKADKPAKKESREKQEPAGSGYEQMTLGVQAYEAE